MKMVLAMVIACGVPVSRELATSTSTSTTTPRERRLTGRETAAIDSFLSFCDEDLLSEISSTTSAEECRDMAFNLARELAKLPEELAEAAIAELERMNAETESAIATTTAEAIPIPPTATVEAQG